MSLILDTGEPGFVENGWLGRRLGVGDGAWLEVTEPDGRCVVTTAAGSSPAPVAPGRTAVTAPAGCTERRRRRG